MVMRFSVKMLIKYRISVQVVPVSRDICFYVHQIKASRNVFEYTECLEISVKNAS